MSREIVLNRWLYLLLSLGIGVVILAYQHAAPYSIDVGGIRGDDELFIAGFHQRETGVDDDFRWTEGLASVAIPGIGGGRSWSLHLYMSGYRPPAEPAPRVLLEVNGRNLANFVAEREMSEYEFTVPEALMGADGRLLLEIQPEVFSPEGDPRELGVLVTRITLVPYRGGVAIPAPFTLCLIVASTLILFLFLRWAGTTDKVSVLLSGVLLLALSFTIAVHRQYVTWYSLLTLTLLAGAFFGALSFQVLLNRLAHRKEWDTTVPYSVRPLVGVLLLALACNLALAPTPGFVGNMGIYVNWTWKLTAHGLHTAYLPDGLVGSIDYLPLIPYLLSAVGWLYGRLFSAVPFPLEQPTLLLWSIMKLPTVAANMCIGVLIFRFVQGNLGFRLALIASTAYLFNPAVLFNSAYGGNTDAIHSLFVLLAIILLLSNRSRLAWLSISLAALSKPQGALFLPLVLFLTWRGFGVRGVLKGALVASVVVLMVFSPFYYRGTWDSLHGYLFSLSRLDTPMDPAHTTVGAHNLWWVLASGADVEDMTSPLSPTLGIDQLISYRSIGLCLLASFYAFALLKLWKNADERSVPMLGAYVAFACFMSLTQMHENYAFAALPLLALVFPGDKRLVAVYSLLSITLLGNLFLHDAAILDMLGLFRREQLLGSIELINAVTNLVVFVWWTTLLIFYWKPGQLSPIAPVRPKEAA